MNLGFKEVIDMEVFEKIIDIKKSCNKDYVTVSVVLQLNNDLKQAFKNQGFRILENKVELISNNLWQYKFEWN